MQQQKCILRLVCWAFLVDRLLRSEPLPQLHWRGTAGQLQDLAKIDGPKCSLWFPTNSKWNVLGESTSGSCCVNFDRKCLPFHGLDRLEIFSKNVAEKACSFQRFHRSVMAGHQANPFGLNLKSKVNALNLFSWHWSSRFQQLKLHPSHPSIS